MAIGKYLSAVFNPHKSVTHFTDYFALITATVVHRSPRHIGRIQTVNCLLVLCALHYLSMGVFPLDTLTRWLCFDCLYVLVPSHRFGRLSSLAPLLVVYLNHRLLVTPDHGLVAKLYDILVVVRPPVKGQPTNRQLRNNHSPTSIVRRNFALVLHLFMTIIALINLLVPYMHWLLASHIYRHRAQLFDRFTMTQLAAFGVGHHVFASLNWLYFYNISHALSLTFTLASALLTVFHVRQRAVVRQLRRSQHFGRTTADHYHRRIRRNLIRSALLLFRIDRMFGRLFTATLWLFCPVNVFMLTYTVYGPTLQWRTTLFNVCFVLYQTNFIFVLHLALARCTAVLHRPSLPLVGLSVRSIHRVGAFRAKLTLANDIGAWHTSNRYGLHYGRFGLISLRSFAEYLVIYAKFMIITYKMVKLQS